MAGTRLPMFPLSGVLFPHASLPLHVFESRYRVMLRECLESDRRFGVVLIERGSEVGGGDQRCSLGTRAVVVAASALADGRWLVEVEGETRICVDEWLPDDPYPQALVEEAGSVADHVPGPLLEDATVRVRRVRALLSEQGGAPALSPDIDLSGGGDAERASWKLCGVAPVDAYDAQRLLAAGSTSERLSHLIGLMEDLEQDLHRLLASE
jgi:Lon protease-like protein